MALASLKIQLSSGSLLFSMAKSCLVSSSESSCGLVIVDVPDGYLEDVPDGYLVDVPNRYLEDVSYDVLKHFIWMSWIHHILTTLEIVKSGMQWLQTLRWSKSKLSRSKLKLHIPQRNQWPYICVRVGSTCRHNTGG